MPSRSYLGPDGEPAPPPNQGWRTSKADSPHGQRLISLIVAGLVSLTDNPRDIWRLYPELQVVNPHQPYARFQEFVRNCKEYVINNNMTNNNNDDWSDASDDSNSDPTQRRGQRMQSKFIFVHMM